MNCFLQSNTASLISDEIDVSGAEMSLLATDLFQQNTPPSVRLEVNETKSQFGWDTEQSKMEISFTAVVLGW